MVGDEPAAGSDPRHNPPRAMCAEPVGVTAVACQAVAAGADLLGMAGGDGTQALVAGVAARHGLPFVVIPAGTRNHFALDLGLDRDDPAASLAALSEGVDLLQGHRGEELPVTWDRLRHLAATQRGRTR